MPHSPRCRRARTFDSRPCLLWPDLPGLKAVAGKHDAPDMPATVKALVQAQVEKHRESAIFLLTVHASMAPEISEAMKLVVELGLQKQTIGVLTMCDHLGRPAMKPLVARLKQEAGGTDLRPHGYVATMTAPLEEEEAEGLTTFEHLQRQAMNERAWFTSQPLLKPLLKEELLTCDTLIDKLNVGYKEHLRRSWAPQTLFRLNRELERLSSVSDELGLPDCSAAALVKTPGIEGELREAACKAALKVLDAGFSATLRACHAEALQPLDTGTHSDLAAAPASLSDLHAVQLAVLRRTADCLRKANERVARDARAALAGDTSPFKLGRFPQFIDEVVQRLEAHAQLSPDALVAAMSQSPQGHLKQLLEQSALAVSSSYSFGAAACGWVESCSEEREKIAVQKTLVGPIKQRVLELLGLDSDASLAELAQLEQVYASPVLTKGDGASKAIIGCEAIFTVALPAGLAPTAVLRSPDGDQTVQVTLTANPQPDVYEFRYTIPPLPPGTTFPQEGVTWKLAIELHGYGIKGSPFPVLVCNRGVEKSLTQDVRPAHCAVSLCIVLEVKKPVQLVSLTLGTAQCTGFGNKVDDLNVHIRDGNCGTDVAKIQDAAGWTRLWRGTTNGAKTGSLDRELKVGWYTLNVHNHSASDQGDNGIKHNRPVWMASAGSPVSDDCIRMHPGFNVNHGLFKSANPTAFSFAGSINYEAL